MIKPPCQSSLKARSVEEVGLVVRAPRGLRSRTGTTSTTPRARNTIPLLREARLEEYEREGILGLDTETGKIVKIEGDAAETVMQGARDNVEIFCEGL